MELHRSPISACSSKFQLSKFRGRLMGAQLTRFWFTFPERMFLPLSLLSWWFFFFFRKRGQKYSGTNQSRQSGTLPGNVIVLDTLCRSSPMLLASSRQPLLSQYSSSHFRSMVCSIFVITFKLSLSDMNKFNILNSYDMKVIYESWKNSGYFIRRNEKTRYE